MDYLSIRSDRVDCWGREDTVAYLSSQIFDRSRSASLIHGDSGIGKTTLFRELQKRITAPGVCVGFHECHRGATADPLLLCLDALLQKPEWTPEAVQDRIRVALQAIRRNLKDFERLKAFCGSIAGATLQVPMLPGIDKIASAITKTVSAAAEIASTQAVMPRNIIPKVPPVVFRDLLELLRAAFPDRRFVFLLDNASADAEALAVGRGTMRTLDSFLSYLATDFARSKSIHFVLSWKDAPESTGVFGVLARQMREYGGDLVPLGPLSPESVFAWLDAELPWFRAAGPLQRDQCVVVSRGLPQVVARWIEEAVGRFDPQLLEALATDVIVRRYAAVAAEATKSPDREPLYQISLMPRILPVESLAVLWQKTPQESYDLLQTWSQDHLITRTATGFSFKHETRQIVTRDSIAEALYDNGRHAADRLLEFLLSNAGYATNEHTLAPEYLDFALSLGHLPMIGPAYKASLEAIASIRAGGGIALAQLRRMLQLPWNTRAALLISSYEVSLPEETAFALESSVVEDNGARLKAIGLYAAAVALAISQRAQASDTSERFDELVDKAVQNVLERPDRFDVGIITATGLVNVLVWYGERGDINRIKTILPILEGLLLRFPGAEDLATAIAHSFSNAVIDFDRAKQPMDEVDRLVGCLRRLQSSHTGNSAIGMLLAKALASAMKRAPERAGIALAELRGLHEVFPDDVDIAFSRIRAMSATIGTYADLGLTSDAIALANELWSLLPEGLLKDKHPVEYATGLYNLSLAYQRANNLEQAVAVLKEVQSLYARDQDVEIAQMAAQGLVNLIGVASESGHLKAVDIHLQSLRRLHKEASRGVAVGIELAKGFVNALTAYANAGRWPELDGMIQEVYSLLGDGEPSTEMRSLASRALAQALAAYGRARRWQQARDVELHAVQLIGADMRGEPDHVALCGFLVTASYVYGEGGRSAELDAVMDLLWALVNTTPSAPALAGAGAMGLGNAAHAYRILSAPGSLSLTLDRICALTARYDLDDKATEAVAAALKDCAEVLFEKGEFQDAFRAVERLQELHTAGAGNQRLALTLSQTLRTAVLFHAGKGVFSPVPLLLSAMEKLYRIYPNNIDFAKNFGMALGVAVAGLHAANRDTDELTTKLFQVTECEEIAAYLREFGIVVIDESAG